MDDDAIVRWAYEVGFLKRLPRTGWLLGGVRRPESVAEHSFRVGVLAYAIAMQEGAHADRAATLGLFHDLPETRIGDVPSVGRGYVHTTNPHAVILDQVEGLPDHLSAHIIGLIDEHESAKTPAATPEALCSRDADKLDCLLQAREYEAEGYAHLRPWVTTMADAVSTDTGKRLAVAAQEILPSAWWDQFAASYGLTREE